MDNQAPASQIKPSRLQSKTQLRSVYSSYQLKALLYFTHQKEYIAPSLLRRYFVQHNNEHK